MDNDQPFDQPQTTSPKEQLQKELISQGHSEKPANQFVEPKMAPMVIEQSKVHHDIKLDKNRTVLQQFYQHNESNLVELFGEMCESNQQQKAIKLGQLKDLLSISFKAGKVSITHQIKQSTSFFESECFDELLTSFLSENNQSIISQKQNYFYDDIRPLLQFIANQSFIEMTKQNQALKLTPEQKLKQANQELEKALLLVRVQLERRLEFVKDGKSVEVTITAIQAVSNQLQDLLKPNNVEIAQTPADNKFHTKRRMQKLGIIFNYYCKMSYQQGKEFDKINEWSQTLTIRKFICFCKDFKLITLKVPLQTLVTLFKKNSSAQHTMDFDTFIVSVESMASLQLQLKQPDNQKIAGYFDSIVETNTRKKLREVHKQPFEKAEPGLQPMKDTKSYKQKKFSLQPHTGMLPQQLQDNLKNRFKVREMDRLKRMPDRRSNFSSNGSQFSMRGNKEPDRVIRLSQLRSSKADRSLVAELLDDEPIRKSILKLKYS